MSLIPALFVLALIALLLRLMSLPMQLLYKLIFNTLGGYLCLLLINLFAGWTGVAFSLNIVTAVVVGFLGIPGILLLYFLRFVLL